MNDTINLKSSIVKKEDGSFLIKVDKEKFAALSDFDKCQFIHELNIENSWNEDIDNIDFDVMNPNQKALCCLYIIPGMIGEGGFVSFFQETQDYLFEEGLKAFELIGDTSTQKIFEKAIEIYKKNEDSFLYEDLDESPIDEKIEEELEELENLFFDLDDARDQLMYDLVNNNLKDFIV